MAHTTDGSNAPLETARLRLRQMQLEDVDVDPLLRVFGDADTMRFYPSPFTREQMAAWIEWNLRSYNEHGYGLWALVLKETNEVIGDCGLTWQRVGYGDGRELEAGWHVRRDLWSLGLATEAGFSVRDYAHDVLQRERLIAIINAENLPSQSVARKLACHSSVLIPWTAKRGSSLPCSSRETCFASARWRTVPGTHNRGSRWGRVSV